MIKHFRFETWNGKVFFQSGADYYSAMLELMEEQGIVDSNIFCNIERVSKKQMEEERGY